MKLNKENRDVNIVFNGILDIFAAVSAKFPDSNSV